MTEVTVSKEIRAPVELLWQRIRDFGEVSWMNGISRVELEGEGVGMARLIYVGDDPPIREELEACDPALRSIGYTITQRNPLPVDDYHATVRVIELDAQRSQIDWSARFTPVGVSGEEAATAVRGMYGILIGWIEASVTHG